MDVRPPFAGTSSPAAVMPAVVGRCSCASAESVLIGLTLQRRAEPARRVVLRTRAVSCCGRAPCRAADARRVALRTRGHVTLPIARHAHANACPHGPRGPPVLRQADPLPLLPPQRPTRGAS